MSKLSATGGKKQFPDGDFTKINNAIIETYLTKLKPRQLRILLVLAYRANNMTQIAEWTQEKIAEKAGCTDRWLREALAGLVEMRLIKRVGRDRYRVLPVPETGIPEQVEPELQRRSDEPKPEFQSSQTGLPEHANRNSRARPFNVLNQTQLKDSLSQTGPRPNAQARPEPPVITLTVGSPSDTAEQLRHAIEECWERTHGGTTPWTPRAQQMVNQQVAKIPFTGQQWTQCVENRFASDGVNLGHLPEKFIAQLTDFLAGPLNRFGEPRDGLNGYDPNLPKHSNINRHSAMLVERDIHAALSDGRDIDTAFSIFHNPLLPDSNAVQQDAITAQALPSPSQTDPQPEEVEKFRKGLEEHFKARGGYTITFIEDLRQQAAGTHKAAVLEEALLKIEAVYGPPHGQYVN